MKREFARTAMMVGLSALILAGTLSTPARAEVNVNINIGPPPPVVVQAPPTMLFLPQPAMYVAVGIPYDIYFVSGRYYYMRGDHWFWAAGYGGPWVYVEDRSLPPGLRKFKIKDLQKYRDHEYEVYRVQGSNFKGQHFVAVSGPSHGNEGNHGNSGNAGNSGNGNGNSQGRGRGKK